MLFGRCFFQIFVLNFGGHKSFLWDHWYPCSGLLVMSPMGYKARVGSLICTQGRCTCYISPWFTSGAIPADLLADLGSGIYGVRNGDLSCRRSQNGQNHHVASEVFNLQYISWQGYRGTFWGTMELFEWCLDAMISNKYKCLFKHTSDRFFFLMTPKCLRLVYMDRKRMSWNV